MKTVLKSYVSLVHELLDYAEVPHFVHHVSNNSIFLYVSSYYHSHAALQLRTLPFVKGVKAGFDVDDECFIELYF